MKKKSSKCSRGFAMMMLLLLIMLMLYFVVALFVVCMLLLHFYFVSVVFAVFLLFVVVVVVFCFLLVANLPHLLSCRNGFLRGPLPRATNAHAIFVRARYQCPHYFCSCALPMPTLFSFVRATNAHTVLVRAHHY